MIAADTNKNLRNIVHRLPAAVDDKRHYCLETMLRWIAKFGNFRHWRGRRWLLRPRWCGFVRSRERSAAARRRAIGTRALRRVGKGARHNGRTNKWSIVAPCPRGGGATNNKRGGCDWHHRRVGAAPRWHVAYTGIVPGGRGRDASYLAPPAQIRTCIFLAYS